MSNDIDKLYTCCQCGDELTASQFYKVCSKLYKNTGFLPICKKCFEKNFNDYVLKYRSTKQAMKRMCMAFDLYYNDDIFDSLENDETLVGKYFRKLNMFQYKDKTFDNSILERFEFFEVVPRGNKVQRTPKNTEEKPLVEKPPVNNFSKKDIEKWGEGLEQIDYDILNSHYKYLKNANPNCDSNQEIFINDLCYTKMQQMRAVRKGEVDDYNKLTESYRKSFVQAGLKTVRDNAEVEDFTIGIGIETIEKYTPAEYYKDKKMYEDFDNLGDYFKRAVLRPLRNAFLGTNERDDEFCIKQDGDYDE